jgi:hypothetical protein
VPEIEDGDHLTACRRTLSSRSVGAPIVGTPSPAPDIAYGLGLLASDSPIGDHGEVDEQLLEYDSDESAVQQHLVAQIQSDSASMDTESQQHTDTKAAADSNTNVILDDMYHQCRASRISVHRDNLVSICPDGTFGKKIISQAVPVGSFEDHNGIETTFRGSRILKGNVSVNQSLSSSFDPSNLNCVCCKSEHPIIGVKPFFLTERIVYF